MEKYPEISIFSELLRLQKCNFDTSDIFYGIFCDHKIGYELHTYFDQVIIQL